MKFMVVVHPEKDGIWTVECPSIPGCVSQGSTKTEALKRIAEAIAVSLKARAEQGLSSATETRELEVVITGRHR
jgi:predicted RNase H-like HicB family nuclease